MESNSFMTNLLSRISDADGGIAMNIAEFKERQYGLQLPFFILRYLYAATGLRFGVMHSLSGMPQTCKTPFLLELMKWTCMDRSEGGQGGIGYYYEMEYKLSPSLVYSLFADHPELIKAKPSPFNIIQHPKRDGSVLTLEQAEKHMTKKLLPTYASVMEGNYGIPLLIGMDSIGGSASDDVVKKLETDGTAGKGYYDKTHIMKHLSENISGILKDLPVVVVCINQEKERQAGLPGQQVIVKKVTGGDSQVFKFGHMASFSMKKMHNGKLVRISTTKTSFSDDRKAEIRFTWNQFGSKDSDSQGHRWHWELAGAKLLADPSAFGQSVGDLRDIIEVKVSEADLVTCPTLGLKSVPPEEFEKALNADTRVLHELYRFYKIEELKSVDEYAEYKKARKEELKKKKDSAVEVSQKAPDRKKPVKTDPLKKLKQMAKEEGEQNV